MVEMMRNRVKILTGIGSKLALRWKSTESQVLKKAYQDGERERKEVAKEKREWVMSEWQIE